MRRMEERGTNRLPALTWWLAGVVVLMIAAGVFALVERGRGRPIVPAIVPGIAQASAAPATARRETRPTLDPARFVGKAAATHRIAREIPDVLDQLYCYCQCDKSIGHKSLLSCYTDGHAAT